MNPLDPVEFRKSQENLVNMIKIGYFRQIADLHKASYDAYVEAGFTSEQSLELLKAIMNRDKKGDADE